MLYEQNRQLADSSVELDEQTRRRLESLGYVGSRENMGTIPDVYTQDPPRTIRKTCSVFTARIRPMVQLMARRTMLPRARCAST